VATHLILGQRSRSQSHKVQKIYIPGPIELKAIQYLVFVRVHLVCLLLLLLLFFDAESRIGLNYNVVYSTDLTIIIIIFFLFFILGSKDPEG